MTAYNRRRLLRDMGLLTASLAAPWPMACKCTSCSDLFVILEGPWLVSITHPLYMRAITTRMVIPAEKANQPKTSVDKKNGPVLSVDKKNQPGSPADRDDNQTSHIFTYFDPRYPDERKYHRDMGGCRMTHFDVRPHCNIMHSQARRDSLFDAMCDQAWGIFYTPDIACPDIPDCSKSPLELQLSYPDEIIPMGLQDGVTFDCLDCVKGGKINLWPSALLLRYKRWRSAIFFGDSCERESLDPSAGEVHRKISVEFILPHPDPLDCASYKKDFDNGKMHFSNVVGLLNSNQKPLPVPTYPTCTDPGKVNDNFTQTNWGPITSAELGTTYLGGRNKATDLVNCAAGSVGVTGHS